MLSRFQTSLRRALEERRQTPARSIRAPILLLTLGVAAAIATVVLLAPSDDVARHFHEDGAVTALSATLMAAAAGLSATTFFLSREEPRAPALFWLACAAAFAFFALDELLRFHERLGGQMDEALGEAPWPFRHWNDLVVIGYGIVAIPVCLLFLPEILRVPRFAALLATAIGCYVLHTAIDSTFDRTATSMICEEGAKLYSATFFALAFFAGVVGMSARNAARNLAGPTA